MDPFGKVPALIDREILPTWIIREDEQILAINKPGWVVCHPAKNGPYSSLLGALQERAGDTKLHLVTRLDRETSGLVLLAKSPEVTHRYQQAMHKQKVSKRYVTILEGDLCETTVVDQSIGRRLCGPVIVKRAVHSRPGSQAAVTKFIPIINRNGFTLCEVLPKTGRTHQIRVHAEWLGHSVVGDQIYGPDEMLFIDFIEHGWTERISHFLHMKRQALHCQRYVFEFGDEQMAFATPLPTDMKEFCVDHMQLNPEEVDSLSLETDASAQRE